MREGIEDVLSIHDCFSCLAPRANRFKEIIRGEMAAMYQEHDPLTALHVRNDGEAHIAPLKRGTLDPAKILSAGFSFI
jgi:hypothetical protein